MPSKAFEVAVRIAAKDDASSRSRAIFKAIEGSAHAASAGISSAFRSVMNLKSAIVGLTAGYLGMEGVRKVNEWGTDTAELSRYSRQIGFNIEDFQTFEDAALGAGIGQETFRKSIGFAMKELGALHVGAGKIVAEAKKHSDFRDVASALVRAKSPDEAIQIELKAMRLTTDATKKAYLARLFFGKGGMEMIRVSELSAAALEEEREAAKKNGLVTVQSGLDAEAYKRSTLDAEHAVKGLSNAIGSELLPVITPAVGRFAEWVRQHRALIATKARTFVEGIGKAVGWLADTGLPAMDRGLAAISSHWETIKAGSELFVAMWAGSKVITGIGVVAGVFASIASSLAAANALATGGAIATAAAASAAPGGLAMAASFAGAMGGPIGVLIGAAIGAGVLAYLKYDNHEALLNNRDEVMGGAEEARKWANAMPYDAEQAEQTIYNSTHGVTIEEFRKSPFYQNEVGKEIKARAAKQGFQTPEQAREAAFADPLKRAPADNPYLPHFQGNRGMGRVGVEIDFTNLPKGVRTKIKHNGGVDLSGTVSRAPGGDDPEDFE